MRYQHFCLFILMLFTMSCSNAQIKSPVFGATVEGLLSGTVDTISVSHLAQTIGQDSMVILDAREKREYEVSHIEGAIWVGYDDFNLSRLDSVDTSMSVVVYCSVGYRSEKIGERLYEAGYQDVTNLYGGIFEWVNQGGDVYNNKGKTKDVHGYDEKWSKFLSKGNVVIE